MHINRNSRFDLYLGFMKAPQRGHFVLNQLVFCALFGGINGYVTARYYKAFNGKEQRRTTTIAAFGLSGIVFTLFMIVECISLTKGSSYVLPIRLFFPIVILWVGISVPLVYLGAHWGYAQDSFEYPFSTSSIPREIPRQPWYRSGPVTVQISGAMPFLICFVEFYYILSAAWMEYYYDAFGYLLIILLLVVVVVAEQAVLFTFYQLCNEDYHWWWRAFWNGGSVGIVIFLYSMKFFQQLEASSLASFILYLGYMGFASLAIFAMMGFVGVSSSLYFNIFLYSSIETE